MRYARPLILSLLTLSFLAGCGTQVGTTWRHETVSSKAKAAARAAAKATPTPKPSASTTPATPAATASVTYNFVATLRGQALSGFDVQVFDARNGQRFETGATVQAVDAKTGTNGGFQLKVAGIPDGQALRVVAAKGGFAVEAVLTSNMPATQGVVLDETSTALARLAAGPLAASQVLTVASAPVVTQRLVELQLLRPALSAKLAGTVGFEGDVTRADSLSAQSKALRRLVNAAGLTQEVAAYEVELVKAVALKARTEDNRSDLADDPAVLAGLQDFELVGTMLRAAYDGETGAFTLKNGADGSSVDATGNTDTVLRVLKH